MDAKPNIETEQRLLDAAGEVFAEQGFKDATIRDICTRAGANIAAVNYHYGDKQALYAAVLRQVHRCAENQEVLAALADQGVPAEERLGEFIRGFIHRIAGRERPAWHGKLMAREMADPTLACDQFVEEDIKPRSKLLGLVVAELLGKAGTPEKIRRAMCSIVGQVTFYHHSRGVLDRIFPKQTFDGAELEAIAEHITKFSLAGIEAMK